MPEKEYKLKMLAGRGSGPQINWGVGKRPEDVVMKEYQELQKFIGKKLVLTGGGGFGMREVILDEVELVENALFNQPTIKTKLTIVNPKEFGGRTTFDPWISSWQLSELVEA